MALCRYVADSASAAARDFPQLAAAMQAAGPCAGSRSDRAGTSPSDEGPTRRREIY